MATGAVNADPLQTLEQDILGAINAPTQTLLGRPLIGNGANGYTDAQGIGRLDSLAAFCSVAAVVVVIAPSPVRPGPAARPD